MSQSDASSPVDAAALEAFTGSLATACRRPEVEQLRAALGELCSAAALALGELAPPVAALCGYFGERVQPGRDPLDQLARFDGAELALALACADGCVRAQRRFEVDYFGELRVGASRLRCSDEELDEITQAVRRMLFAPGPDGRAPLVHKTGRGELRALLRLMALRAGISLRRRGGRLQPADSFVDLVDRGDSPSLLAVKHEHRAKFRAALHRAVASLEPAARTLLRLHEVDGLTLAALARIHRVDRSTITRRLARTRAAILQHTRDELAAQFGVEQRDFDSFIDVIRSDFAASIHRALASGG